MNSKASAFYFQEASAVKKSIDTAVPQVWNKQSTQNPSCSGLLCSFRNEQQCSVLMGLYFTYSLNACTVRYRDKNLESLTRNCCLYVGKSLGIVVHSVGLSLWRKAYLSLLVFIQHAFKIIASTFIEMSDVPNAFPSQRSESALWEEL